MVEYREQAVAISVEWDNAEVEFDSRDSAHAEAHDDGECKPTVIFKVASSLRVQEKKAERSRCEVLPVCLGRSVISSETRAASEVGSCGE